METEPEMFKNLTIEELEAKIDAVGEALEADPKNRELYNEMDRLLTEFSDRTDSCIYGGKPLR